MMSPKGSGFITFSHGVGVTVDVSLNQVDALYKPMHRPPKIARKWPKQTLTSYQPGVIQDLPKIRD